MDFTGTVLATHKVMYSVTQSVRLSVSSPYGSYRTFQSVDSMQSCRPALASFDHFISFDKAICIV